MIKNVFYITFIFLQKSNNFLKRNYFSTANWEQNASTRFKLTEFLCKFVDHCFKDVDYVIKEQHFFEKLCNILFPHAEENSVFYIGNITFQESQ